MRRVVIALALVAALMVATTVASAQHAVAISPIVTVALAGPGMPPGATIVTVTNDTAAPIMYGFSTTTSASGQADRLHVSVRRVEDDKPTYEGPLEDLVIVSDVALAPTASTQYVVTTDWSFGDIETSGNDAALSFDLAVGGWVAEE